MTDVFIKIFGFIIEFFFPGKLIELQIKVNRLDINNVNEIQDFIEVYDETFPYDGSNYTSGELLELFEDINNNKRHVTSDNIILVAKYKDSVVGFIACFYYPEKQYGIIGYFGKTKSFREEGKYVGTKLLKKLKAVLVEEHNCKLVVFELEFYKRDKTKTFLFKSYAKHLGLILYELSFEYYRPKLNMEDIKEERLKLLIIPISEPITIPISKEKVLDILSFIHLYCYGDYYERHDKMHQEFQNYMASRIDYYSQILPDIINVR